MKRRAFAKICGDVQFRTFHRHDILNRALWFDNVRNVHPLNSVRFPNARSILFDDTCSIPFTRFWANPHNFPKLHTIYVGAQPFASALKQWNKEEPLEKVSIIVPLSLEELEIESCERYRKTQSPSIRVILNSQHTFLKDRVDYHIECWSMRKMRRHFLRENATAGMEHLLLEAQKVSRDTCPLPKK